MDCRGLQLVDTSPVLSPLTVSLLMQCCSTVKVQLTSSHHFLMQVPAGHTTPSATLRCAQPGGKSVLEADRSVLEADLQIVKVHAADGTLAVTATCDTCLSAIMESGSCHIFMYA